jgi:hypothetical protein
MLERSHEAERLNAELGEQNAQLLRENAALRARDSRPASAPGGRRLFTSPAVPGFRRWYTGVIAIIAILAGLAFSTPRLRSWRSRDFRPAPH